MTEEQWDEVIKRWEQSGLTQLQFCKQYEIDYRVFKRWRTEGLASGRFNPSTRWTNKSESVSFAKVTTLPDELPATTHHDDINTKFIEINLPHGILLKVPV
jgi:hypothetical protein